VDRVAVAMPDPRAVNRSICEKLRKPAKKNANGFWQHLAKNGNFLEKPFAVIVQ
jgi:hypothetical protein